MAEVVDGRGREDHVDGRAVVLWMIKGFDRLEPCWWHAFVHDVSEWNGVVDDGVLPRLRSTLSQTSWAVTATR